MNHKHAISGQRVGKSTVHTYIGLHDKITEGLNAVSRQYGGYLTLTQHTIQQLDDNTVAFISNTRLNNCHQNIMNE